MEGSREHIEAGHYTLILNEIEFYDDIKKNDMKLLGDRKIL